MVKHSAHGFVSYTPDGSPSYLPLKSVSAKIYIVDVSARVVLTQLFANDRNNAVSANAQYIFPVPANGAVCAFKMQTTDGRVVKGVVKERLKAEQEYEIAISQNQFAGLLYEATPDVFVISIGTIPRNQDVEVTIMYVVALSDGDLPGYDQVHFSLPTYVATRYGAPPPEISSVSSSTVNTMFDISADIQMPTNIVSITSSSHSIKVYTTNVKDSSTPLYTSRVTLDPTGPPPRLNRDFVLSIQASKLGQPRCVAERRHAERTVALSLTFVPRFRMESIPTQEYVFLIDRSGSMAGSRIHHAKEALVLFLKSLPSQGTLFNIFSFGSSYSSLWPSSRKYTASDINLALNHVQSMDADMGGTEIKYALEHSLRSRNLSVPMSVFLVTDGEVWADDIFTLVSSEVARANTSPSSAHLRVFTLGVGDAASTALCEGVARRGNGLCLMTTENEDISQKCARLLLASTVPPSGNTNDVEIDWGYIPSKSSNNLNKGKASDDNGAVTILYDDNYDPLATLRPQVILPDLPGIQQAPSHVPNLYPANRFTVSAILSNTRKVPKTVTLRGKLPDGSTIVLPPIQVHQTLVQHDDFPPLLHTLAAHRLILELEDGITDSQGSFDSNDEALREAVIQSAVVRFSETYQLASKFASFIAVGEDGGEPLDDSSDDDPDNDHAVPYGSNSGIQNGSVAIDLDDGDEEEVVDGVPEQDNAHSDRNDAVGDLARRPPRSFSSSAHKADIHGQSIQPQPHGTSTGQTGYAAMFSSSQGMPTSRPSKKSVSFTSALPPLVIDDAPSNAFVHTRDQPSQFTQSSFFGSQGGSKNLSQRNDVDMQQPQSTTSRQPCDLTTSTAEIVNAQFDDRAGTAGLGSAHDTLSIPYSFDVVANRDGIQQTPSQDSLQMPGGYPTDRTVPSHRSANPRTHHSLVGVPVGTTASICPSRKIPGSYPLYDLVVGTPSPVQGNRMTRHSQIRSSVSSTDQQWPGSIPYILETVACSDNSTAMMGTLDTADPEDIPTPPVYLLSASSKSGLYKAPRRGKPVAIAPWTTGVPIVAVARLQSFDGSFELDDKLHSLLGKKVTIEHLRAVIPDPIRDQRDAEKIWATVVAAAYLKKAFPNDKEVWIGLWNKAAAYVKLKLGTELSFASFVDEASRLL